MAWSDEEILEVLHLKENQRMTGDDVAHRMSETLGREVSRDAIIGLIHRINQATDKADTTPHLNGTMPARWWKRD